MSDALDNGYGSVAGSRGSPVAMLDFSAYQDRMKLVEIGNNDGTNWLFVRFKGSSIPFLVILPGATGILSPEVAGEYVIEGFGATPNEGGAATIQAYLASVQ